jgi:hypothetical protein
MVQPTGLNKWEYKYSLQLEVDIFTATAEFVNVIHENLFALRKQYRYRQKHRKFVTKNLVSIINK